MMKTRKKAGDSSFLITVFGSDRPGIIAAITEQLYRQKWNLEDIEMSILEGQFAMMMIASASKPEKAGAIQKDLELIGKKMKLAIQCVPIKQRLSLSKNHPAAILSYLVTAIGPDKTGIVYELSRLLAGVKGNITGFHSRLVGREKAPLFSLMLEVDIPKKLSPLVFKEKIQKLSKALNLDIHLKPQFSVTL